MFAPVHDFFRALNRARRATRTGDHKTAEHWTRIAEPHLKISERLNRLAEPPPSATTGPVMLDPNGFSPGGTPNRILNQQRMERSRVGQINPVK